ncbi:MAG: hypothetical protein LBU18_06050, partial [Treponema sp.]|nr:hypothetical protein [Treponema sp.]
MALPAEVMQNVPTIEEFWAAFTKSQAEAAKRQEEWAKEWAKYQAEAAKRQEEADKRQAEADREAAKRREEADKRQEEAAKRYEKWERGMEELRAAHKETERIVNRVGRQMG